MATIGELLVKLGLDPATYTKGLSTAESKTKTSMGNAGKSFDDAGTHVSKFGSIMSGMAVGAGIALTNLATDGIGKIVGVLGDSEKAYQNAAVSTAQFNTALKNNIPGINDQKQALGDTSDAMQSVMEDNLKYGFSMDDQRSTMALLVGVTKDGDQALADSAEAMDLARLKGIDLASATSIVMKAQEGNTGALKKLGIIVAPVTTAMDKLTATNKKATDAQKAVAKAADLQATETASLAAIQKMAGGQAEAYANTSAGKLAAAHAKVTEAEVKLGAITDQIVQAVMPGLADAFENIMDAVGPVLQQLGQDMPGVISTVNAAIGTLSDALSPIVKVFAADIPGAINTVKAAISSLLPSFGSGSGAASGLGKDMTALQKTFSVVFADIQSIVKGALGILENVWKTFGGDIMAVVKVYMQYYQDTIQNVLQYVQGIFDIFAGLFSGDWSKVWKGVQEVFGAIWNQIGSLLKAALDLIPIMLDAAGKIIGGIWSNIWHGLETAVGVVWGGIAAVIKGYIGLINAEFNVLVGFVTGLPGAIGKAAVGMFDGIWNAFKGAINMIIKGWNSLEFKFGGFDLGPLGKVASFDMKVPKIPTLHGGGIVPGTPGTDVLALLQAGERVTSARDVAQGAGGNTFYITNPVPEPPSVSMAHANLMLAYSGRSGN